MANEGCTWQHPGNLPHTRAVLARFYQQSYKYLDKFRPVH